MFGQLVCRRGVLRLLAAAAGLLAATLATAAWRWAHAPRVWKPREVAVAFWSWRAETPTQSEVERASKEARSRVLFMRAGQLDFDAGRRVVRVRAVKGRAPSNVELHLVYNATPALLDAFERIDEGALASVAVETFRADSERATKDGATVAGLQLDIDAPTRLLARYGRVLQMARASLPANTRLSVTGLPTWMNARAPLREMLGAVDFWVPQFYGAEIPSTADARAPIASPEGVRRESARAREVGKPFYAGLAGYGYALVYTPEGRLVELSGDVDPARVASDRNFELVERRAFGPNAGSDAPHAGEWRYVYRAREDAVLGDVLVRAGERIALDVPSGESLRASARGVRETAGDSLLGVCVFRLPTRGDRTTLGLAQVAAALEDRDTEVSARVTLTRARSAESEEGSTNQLLIEALNDGGVAARYGDGALTLTLRVPRGSLRGVTSLEGFDTFETLCESRVEVIDESNHDDSHQSSNDNASQSSRDDARPSSLRPCGAARASVVRLGVRAWDIGTVARAGLSFEDEPPASLPASIVVRRGDGGEWARAVSLGASRAGLRSESSGSEAGSERSVGR
jgi:hypothetical protein